MMIPITTKHNLKDYTPMDMLDTPSLLLLVMLPTPTLPPMAWDTLATPMDLDMLLAAETILELLFHARIVSEVYCFLLKISKMLFKICQHLPVLLPFEIKSIKAT